MVLVISLIYYYDLVFVYLNMKSSHGKIQIFLILNNCSNFLDLKQIIVYIVYFIDSFKLTCLK